METDKRISPVTYNKILLGETGISYGSHLAFPYRSRKIKIIHVSEFKKKVNGKRPDTLQHGFEYKYIPAKILMDFMSYQDHTDMIKHLIY